MRNSAMTISSKPTIIVTGASTGIGRAIAEHLAASGFYVFGSVRKSADADDLNAALKGKGQALLFDVTDAEAIADSVGIVRAHLGSRHLAGLINNAGVALPGPTLLQPLDEIEKVIDINLMGVVRCVQAFAPLLGAEPGLSGPKGRIINITSASGKFGYPFTAAYVASKHAVEGFSDSLRRELMLVGIDVIVVGPGAVRTPIWGKGAANDKGRYDNSIWAVPLKTLKETLSDMDANGLEVQVIADVVHTALTATTPRTRYAPVRNKLLNWWLPRFLPPRMVDTVVAKRLNLKP
jgi:NAD(P)-dependent dehydrogenase (short-subunit alcohol dehydrogenase family)